MLQGDGSNTGIENDGNVVYFAIELQIEGEI